MFYIHIGPVYASWADNRRLNVSWLPSPWEEESVSSGEFSLVQEGLLYCLIVSTWEHSITVVMAPATTPSPRTEACRAHTNRARRRFGDYCHSKQCVALPHKHVIEHNPHSSHQPLSPRWQSIQTQKNKTFTSQIPYLISIVILELLLRIFSLHTSNFFNWKGIIKNKQPKDNRGGNSLQRISDEPWSGLGLWLATPTTVGGLKAWKDVK